VELSATLGEQRSEQSHMNKLQDWLQAQAQKAAEGAYPNVPDCQSIVNASAAERSQMIQTIYQQTHDGTGADVATAVYRIFQGFGDLMTGEADALNILLEDDILSKIYQFLQLWDYDQLFQLIAHSKPNLRILEIGAGTGGTTSTILPALISESGERMYFSYTYSDVSSGFFVTAKERFRQHEGFEYAVLDISRDPLEQGFEAASFDLIIASNVS